jgi:drug/metabolite transporter (DMT)-like permease
MMSKIEVVFLVGLCLAVAGVAIGLEAGALATHWETGDHMTVGVTDPADRRTYQVLGLLLAVAGAVGMGMAAWRWLAQGGTKELGRRGGPVNPSSGAA